ncbi:MULTISPECIES: carbohydrate ABC transporter permease [Robinsoniella]|uniref:carbohydrate ABC transporter permease n=1 Tax=Robinsoniella TaxID=588605 RepID=UPI0005C7CEAA|nr:MULTISPECIES: sugar ABC transporter permease [Robinsoniella]
MGTHKIKQKSKLESKLKFLGALMVLPCLFFILVDQYIPIGWNIILSLQEWDGFKKLKWVYFKNYINFFQDSDSLKALYHSVLLGFISTVFAILLGLIVAFMIYKLRKSEGSFLRLVFFTPIMLPTAIVGLLFTFVFNSDMGILNQLLRAVGAGSMATAWLENKGTAMVCIAIVSGWKLFGVTMMLGYTAIQNIPSSLIESSYLDGAGYLKQIRYIILPLIKPTIQLAAIFSLTTAFRTYDLVWAMTMGGPGNLTTTVPIEMIKRSFVYNEFGYSAATGCILTVVVLIFIFITNKLLGGESYEY